MIYRLVITPTQKQDEQIILTTKQQHYLKRVLRLGNGDRFLAMDGQGQSWLAQLTGTFAQIIESRLIETELPVAITLIVALPKGKGFDDIVRCSTELGVNTLMPVISDRTLLKPSYHKLERWRRIAQEATEQSERLFVPKIVEPSDFLNTLPQVIDSDTDCYICVARRNITHLLTSLQTREKKKIVIATGSEGGWTTTEVEEAISTGFQAVSLGQRILRAVTAPIVALSLATGTIDKTSSERS